MRFFDKDFFKFTFQFLAMISLGMIVISFVSSLNSGSEITAKVVDGQ